MMKINEFLNMPNFNDAKAGDKAFSVEYGDVEIYDKLGAEYNNAYCILVYVTDERYAEIEIEGIYFDNRGYIFRDYGMSPKHPSLFNSYEQFRKYWGIDEK